MVRYFWNPNTGDLDKRATVRAIRRSFGDIPFFVSKPFAQAYKIDEALGLAKNRFEGSTPAIGWSRKDVEQAVEPIKEQWGQLTQIETKPAIEEYLESIQEVLKERREALTEGIEEIYEQLFTVGYVRGKRSEAWIYSSMDEEFTRSAFEKVALSFDPENMHFSEKMIEFDPAARIPDPAIVVIKTDHGVYVYDVNATRIDKDDTVDLEDYVDSNLFDVFPLTEDIVPEAEGS